MGGRHPFRFSFLLASGLALAGGGQAASMEAKNNPVSFSGTIWSRYSYTLEDLSASDGGKDQNRFEIDRVYLGFQAQLGEKYAGNAILEMQNANSGKIEDQTFLKRADIVVTSPFGLGGSEARMGQTPGAITPIQEKAWGYRAVQKVTTDLWLGVSTTYLGAGWTGSWFDGLAETELLVANRAGYNKDVAAGYDSIGADPKYKAFAARAYVRPIREGSAKNSGFGAYVQLAPTRSPSSDNKTIWYGGHAYFDGQVAGRPATAGVQYDGRNIREGGGGSPTSDVTASVVSAIARVYVSDRIEIFSRVDLVDFDTDREDILLESGEDVSASTPAAQTLFMAGVSHAYTNSLRSILDVSIRSFSDDVRQQSGNVITTVDTDAELIVSARLDAKL